MKTIFVCMIIGLLFLSGCAHLEFTDFKDKGGITYYDPKPYLFISTNKDCVTTAAVVVLPEKKKTVILHSGFGSADLSINLTNGMFTSVGQKTDTHIPEMVSAIASLGTAAGSIVKIRPETGKQVTCPPSATLFPIKEGAPDVEHPVKFEVEREVVDFK